MSDFYNCGTNNLALKADLEAKYNVELTDDDIRELHYVVRTTRQRLNIPPDTITEPSYPSQPLLMSIINLTKKGCGAYYKLLKNYETYNRGAWVQLIAK